nr:conserved putative secreted protein [Marseillevirus cajuinensis]
MLLLVLAVLLFLSLLLFCRKEDIFAVEMVKVKSRDPLLPIKYAWWFKQQKAERPPVFMFFKVPSGQILHSFTLDVPDADKASFLSNIDVPFLDLQVKDEKDRTLWEQTVRF